MMMMMMINSLIFTALKSLSLGLVLRISSLLEFPPVFSDVIIKREERKNRQRQAGTADGQQKTRDFEYKWLMFCLASCSRSCVGVITRPFLRARVVPAWGSPEKRRYINVGEGVNVDFPSSLLPQSLRMWRGVGILSSFPPCDCKYVLCLLIALSFLSSESIMQRFFPHSLPILSKWLYVLIPSVWL